ncbi:hypothetical protein METBIDRAFT_38724 [Metschnikowia bicuspidata var. bicuspidata NRRL YB-4993]|uniref:Survival protein SurE-like phosphatase/nucleotidase domain-containing protein n=1 Tax=Metschnikowia bicuspidata var. bicuspidata NRRL YB-4993 TaxID=869754 RepID=A0A1A0HE04_9ASCO|nr:hypothetical protein METBIDRAFT_38724 [Metschnikowia bicuspidata var. bicuspidata NRRL YB-4993]OBA22329.1 hypothetical protein METBIDRAFT_38724 [Metschnikowia bicuspidata var. bicuspidata NRRL YB-4993]
MRLSIISSFCTLLGALPLAASLNILISSTDSWVEKNARYLHPALVEAGHTVVFVGPLHPNLVNSAGGLFQAQKPGQRRKASELPDYEDAYSAGDFGHLKEAHQKYYTYTRKLNALLRGAKGVIQKKESVEFDAEFVKETSELVRNPTYGQDPLNPDFWYVNGSPLEALLVAFDVILPTHVSGFSPDLVLLGPNEGLHLTCSDSPDVSGIPITDLLALKDELEAMRLLAQVKNHRVISVSTEDSHHIYYEDEGFFNVEETSYDKLFKANFVTQNIQFVNLRLISLVDKVVLHMETGQALNVNFPSMNKRLSTCSTSRGVGPQFSQVASSTGKRNMMGKIFAIPQLSLGDDCVEMAQKNLFKVSEALDGAAELSDLEFTRLQHLLAPSDGITVGPDARQSVSGSDETQMRACNADEYKALELCQIAVSVNDLARGSSLSEEILDVVRYL